MSVSPNDPVGKGAFKLADDIKVEDSEIKRVHYGSAGDIGVLFQMHGSVWPKVLPFCILNLLIMGVIVILELKYDIDVTMKATGLQLTAVLVSFLVVSRTSSVLGRFYSAGNILFSMNKACRELYFHSVIFSKHDQSEKAKQWRFEMAYRTIILLRTTMAALEFSSSNVNTWDILPKEWADEVTVVSSAKGYNNTEDNRTTWAHGTRTMLDENLRTPIVLCYHLREQIVKQRSEISPKLSGGEEMNLLGHVSSFMNDFHKLRAFISTPFPFPLVQMARTFLFFWVFTLPFTLCDKLTDPIQVAVMVFIATYGYIGLEFVSVELEDPFGSDPNDFDNLAYAQMVFEDIYITHSKVDGVESAEKLRENVKIIASRLTVVEK